MFWATQPETHLPWLGVAGFVLAPSHLLAALDMVVGVATWVSPIVNALLFR